MEKPTEKHIFRNGCLIALATAGFIGLILLLPEGGGNRPPPPPQFSPPVKVAPAPRAQEPDARLLEQVRPPQGREEKDGTAVAILVDTSGSMKELVQDRDGSMKPKIDIAKRATRRVLETLKEFAGKNPEKLLKVGLYEFSGSGCRPLLPLGSLDYDRAIRVVEEMKPGTGTPIGEALLVGKHDLDRSGVVKKHLLVVTDGENTVGRDPVSVAQAIASLPLEDQAGIHFIAFDVAASRFNGIKETGGTVLGASNAVELDQSMDFILSRKILLEMPEPPKRQEPSPGR